MKSQDCFVLFFHTSSTFRSPLYSSLPFITLFIETPEVGEKYKDHLLNLIRQIGTVLGRITLVYKLPLLYLIFKMFASLIRKERTFPTLS